MKHFFLMSLGLILLTTSFKSHAFLDLITPYSAKKGSSFVISQPNFQYLNTSPEFTQRGGRADYWEILDTRVKVYNYDRRTEDKTTESYQRGLRIAYRADRTEQLRHQRRKEQRIRGTGRRD